MAKNRGAGLHFLPFIFCHPSFGVVCFGCGTPQTPAPCHSAELFLCDRRFVDPSRKFPHPFIRKPFIHRHYFSIYKTAGSFIAMANPPVLLQVSTFASVPPGQG
jgi:hypothetical protein